MNPTQDPFDASFRRQVEEMRLKIDALPRDQRPHLTAMLEATQQQHDELRYRCEQMREVFDRLLTPENSPTVQ